MHFSHNIKCSYISKYEYYTNIDCIRWHHLNLSSIYHGFLYVVGALLHDLTGYNDFNKGFSPSKSTIMNESILLHVNV